MDIINANNPKSIKRLGAGFTPVIPMLWEMVGLLEARSLRPAWAA